MNCLIYRVNGEIFGFIGPNGAGKSTFIRTLLGLLIPTDGSSEIFGKNIQTEGKSIRQKIGYLPDNWNTILGLYNIYFTIYMIVMMGIFSASTGALIFSSEEKNKTAEFLLTKPLTRKDIFMSKIFALFSLVFAIFLFQTAVAFIGVKIFGEGTASLSILFKMQINGLMLLLFFASIGVFVSMFLNPKNNFMGLVVGIVFGSYFIDAISKISDKMNWIGYFSPYDYFDFQVSNPDYRLNFLNIGLMILLCFVILIVSYFKYNKKNISA